MGPVQYQTYGCHRTTMLSMAGIELYRFMTETHVREQLAKVLPEGQTA